jgi:hypothetical protein
VKGCTYDVCVRVCVLVCVYDVTCTTAWVLQIIETGKLAAHSHANRSPIFTKLMVGFRHFESFLLVNWY